MEFLFQDSSVCIQSDKKDIIINESTFILDNLVIDMPGEYEKGGFLCHVKQVQEVLIAHFRVENLWCLALPISNLELSQELLEFIGNVDVLLFPGNKESVSMIEKIDPRLLIIYGDSAQELSVALGHNIEVTSRYKFKESELSPDRTACVILGN